MILTVRNTLFLITVLISPRLGFSQDSTRVLHEIVIQSYQYQRPLQEVPASIGYIPAESFQRFSNTSVLPVANTIAGVRMEERSPGSYRFSIRGSLIRSPFGIRNVKVYWNGFPLTDGGGNTYLNLLDINSLSSAEVIKGPGGSLYGAGTGGVILLNTPSPQGNGITLSAVAGSYGLWKYGLSANLQQKRVSGAVHYAQLQSDGYRQQTALKRQTLNMDLRFNLNEKSILSTSVFFTDLFYETPGGLTRMQFNENPRQARPATATLPGAIEQDASVNNKTVYTGILHDYQWSARWSTRTAIYGAFTQFENAAIRNYEVRDEKNAGARLENQYSFDKKEWKGKIAFGGEYQYFFSPVQVYANERGSRGILDLDDDLTANQLLVFAQAELDMPKNFLFTAGASSNFLTYRFFRRSPVSVKQKRKIDAIYSPRIALLKKLSPQISVFAGTSWGFSPPSLAEVRPSTGTFNNELNPERGVSYEAGFRGYLFNNRFTFDVTAYHFALKETIVIQHVQDGAEYFVNAGSTRQQGLESTLSYTPTVNTGGFFKEVKIWASGTWSHYRFDDYIQNGEDFSDNKVTGVAPTVIVAGADVTTRKGLYANITANYTDHIPLNDANTDFAAEYFLLGMRAGFRKASSEKFSWEIFAGVDNALDKRYSLGNDLNANGRYFNTAAPRNFYAGFIMSLFRK